MFYAHISKSGKYGMSNPTIVTQYAEDEATQIQWQIDNLNFLSSPGIGGVSTVKPLLHIARSPKYDYKNQTWSISCTGFNFNTVPDVISGVSAIIAMNRGGRITDDIIQLCYQGQLIGENKAQPAYIMTANQDQSLLHPTTVYGGDLDLWKVDDLTANMVTDLSFGIVARYKSHPSWPHSTSPILYSISLQIN